jgi:HEAT repeat protein
MKPLPTILLCLACSFGSAGLVYALLQYNRPEPKPPTLASSQPSETEDASEERIRTLEDKVDALNARLTEAENMKPTTIVRHETVAPEKTEANGDDATAGKAGLDPSELSELNKRLKDIESGESAARALRDKAILELNNGNGRAQRDAARLLGKLAAGGDEAAKKALRDAMRSEDADVREWAVEALDDTKLIEFLPDLKALMNDPAPGVREEVTQTLESMPAEKAGPLLVEMLKDKDNEVLMGAIDAIGDAGYKAGINDLLPLTRSADEKVAIAAAVAMRQCGDASVAETWVPTLGARLSSKDVNERRRAVRNLRNLRVESARTYFEQALKDKDWRVRRDAQRGLDRLNDN